MKSKMFQGWYVVFAAHVLLALSFGAAYSFGAFFSQIQAHFGCCRKLVRHSEPRCDSWRSLYCGWHSRYRRRQHRRIAV